MKKMNATRGKDKERRVDGQNKGRGEGKRGEKGKKGVEGLVSVLAERKRKGVTRTRKNREDNNSRRRKREKYGSKVD